MNRTATVLADYSFMQRDGTYLTPHGVPSWDCPDCGHQLHARTRIEWGWTRCRSCQAKATVAALAGAR